MKLLQGATFLAVMSILFVASIFLLGCEEESDDHTRVGPVTISPSTVNYSYPTTMSNVTVTFTANGGKPAYTWSVANTNIGTITSHGNTAVYRPEDTTGGNFVTVTDSEGNSATATITQS